MPRPRYTQLDSSPTTHKTLCSLKQHADSLAFDLNEIPSSSYLYLQKYLKGSLSFAQSGALALQHLEDTKAAEPARAARQKRNRQTLQKGGVLYAYEAREMVKQKEKDTVEKELQKAQRAFDHAQNTVEKKVTKQWKEIPKQMRKAVRDRTRKRRLRWILGREIRPPIVNHPLVSKSFCCGKAVKDTGNENINVVKPTYYLRKKIQVRVNMSRLFCISLKIKIDNLTESVREPRKQVKQAWQSLKT